LDPYSPVKDTVSYLAGKPNTSLERTVRMLALRAIPRPAAQLDDVRFPKGILAIPKLNFETSEQLRHSKALSKKAFDLLLEALYIERKLGIASIWMKSNESGLSLYSIANAFATRKSG
jgi:hypothetical protein